MPGVLCVCFEATVLFLWVNRHLSGITIATSRLAALTTLTTEPRNHEDSVDYNYNQY